MWILTIRAAIAIARSQKADFKERCANLVKEDIFMIIQWYALNKDITDIRIQGRYQNIALEYRIILTEWKEGIDEITINLGEL